MNFAELLTPRIMRFQQSRQREADSIAFISERIAEELEKESLVTALNQQAVQKRNLIAGYNADLTKLVIKGTQAQVNRHIELSQAAQALNLKILGFGNQRRIFLTLQDEVGNMRATKAPEMLREAQARYPVEMRKALVITWLFAGLRNNEILTPATRLYPMAEMGIDGPGRRGNTSGRLSLHARRASQQDFSGLHEAG